MSWKCLCALATIAISRAAAPPKLPFLDWGACPFEGCTYHRWTARKQLNVYDTWEASRRRIAQLSKGETVVGFTGLVITFRPGVIRMDRDFPGQNLKRGETILSYTYRGEGFSAVWFSGRYDPVFDISFHQMARWHGMRGVPLRRHLYRSRKKDMVGESPAQIGPNRLGKHEHEPSRFGPTEFRFFG